MIFFILFWIVIPVMLGLFFTYFLHRNENFGKFCWQLFSDDNDRPSWGRIGSFIALLASISWVTRIVWKTNSLPEFAGIIFFIITLYSINKAAEVWVAIKGAAKPPQA
jgi:hypothetical protein